MAKLIETMSTFPDYGAVGREFFGLLDGLRPWILEKTPGHVFRIESILALYPEARFVLTIRDGRDVLCSARDYWQDRFPSLSRVEDAARRWIHVCQAVGNAIRRWPNRVAVVRYEDMLTKYQQTLAGVFRHLDLSFDLDLLSSIRDANTFHAYAGRTNGLESKGAFYRKGIAGGYHVDLSEGELTTYEDIAGETLASLGYPLHTRKLESDQLLA